MQTEHTNSTPEAETNLKPLILTLKPRRHSRRHPTPIPICSNPIKPNDAKIFHRTAHSNLIKPDQT
jgi:hypothetical protein